MTDVNGNNPRLRSSFEEWYQGWHSGGQEKRGPDDPEFWDTITPRSARAIVESAWLAATGRYRFDEEPEEKP